MKKITLRYKTVSNIRAIFLLALCLLYTCTSSLTYAANPTNANGTPTASNNPTPGASTTPTPNASDLDVRYRNTQGVLWYECGSGGSSGNPNATGNGDAGGCGSPTDGNSNKQQIWNYLTGQLKAAGYSDDEAQKAAAGIMGNMQDESGFNPSAQGPASTCSSGNGAYGLNQWCGDRQTKVKDYATSHGKSTTACVGAQLEYMWSELSGSYSQVLTGMKGKDAATAAHIFNEGPNGDNGFEGGINDSGRQAFATALYKEFTGQGASQTTTQPVSTPVGSTAPSNGTANASNASSTTSCPSSGSTTPDDGQCHNPLRDVKNTSNSRVDGGYDWGNASTADAGDKGPVYAACPAKITHVSQEGTGGSGWPGGASSASGMGATIVYQVTAGKAKDLYIYVTEDCTPKVKEGDTVDTNTPICQFVNKGTAIEMGWAAPNSNAAYLACTDYPKDSSSYASNTGMDFQQFMQSLGGGADTVSTVGGGPSKKGMAGCNGSTPWPVWTTTDAAKAA